MIGEIPDIPDMKKVYKALLGDLPERMKELDFRYKECDSGHRKPNNKTGMCDYCHRHLRYDTPDTDAAFKGFMERRKHMHLVHAAVDTKRLADSRDSEIRAQKSVDWIYGLAQLKGKIEARNEYTAIS